MTDYRNGSLLEFKNINKSFPGVKALDNVSLSVDAGEVMALLGENGAGKSTLVKILSGALNRDDGEIFIGSKPLPRQFGPLESRKYGVAIIYQELSLLSELTVAENIYLTHEPLKVKMVKYIDYKKMKDEAQKQLEKLDAKHIDYNSKVGALPLPEQQMVEIAKALAVDCKVIVMDEPTTSLTWEETKRLFDVIKSLKQHGVTVIYISHRMDEIFMIADTATVMRDGRIVGKVEIKNTSKNEIISMMTGKELKHRDKVSEEQVDYAKRKILFEIKNASDNKFIKDVSLCVYENEILGIGGLIGSKRTELARMIFGADKLKSGQMYISGKKINTKSPGHAIKKGIGYLSENRKEEGLNLGLSLKENIVQTDMKAVSNNILINWSKVASLFDSYKGKLSIKGVADSLVMSLSGGNQQKVAIAKWLHAGCRLIIFDEPTRGIDVAAKAEIYELIRNFAHEGKAAIVISSEVNELVDVCDRVLVMSKGQITSELLSSEITQDSILQHITTKGR